MVIDIIIVAIFIIAAIWGAHKGAIKIIASLGSFILAFALAYTLAGTVGDYIKSTEIGNKIEQAIETRIVSENNEETSDEKIEETDAIGKIEQMLGDTIEESIANNKEALTEKIVGYVFVAIGFLTTFVVVKLVLFIAFAIIELVFKLPVLKTFNKLTGCVLELVLMLLKIWIVLGIISFIAPLEFMTQPIELLNESVITKALYDHNIIVNLIIGRII